MAQNFLQLRDSYDWVILGYSVGSLLSANLVARLGLSVLVVEVAESSNSDVFFSRSGQAFDPLSSHQLGYDSEFFQKLLQACEIKEEEQRSLLREKQNSFEDVFSTFIFEDSDINWKNNFEELWSELSFNFDGKVLNRYFSKHTIQNIYSDLSTFWKEYPSVFQINTNISGSSIVHSNSISYRLIKNFLKTPSFKDNLLPIIQKNFQKYQDHKIQKNPAKNFSKLNGNGNRNRETLYDFFKNLNIQDKEFGNFFTVLESHWKNFTGLDLKKSQYYLLIHLLWLESTNRDFLGGNGKFKKLLLKKAFENGAHVLSNDKTGSAHNVRKVFVDNGSFVGIQLPNFGKMISAKGGVIGCSFHEIESLISKDRRLFSRPLYRKNEKGNKVKAWVFTLALTVNRRVFQDLKRNRYCIQQVGAPPIEVEVSENSFYEYGVVGYPRFQTTEGENICVFLRTQLPYVAESVNENFLRESASKMYHQACLAFPFLLENTIRVFPNIFHDHQQIESMHPNISQLGVLNGGIYQQNVPKLASNEAAQNNSEFFEAYPFSSCDQISSNLLIYEEGFNSSRTPIRGLFCASDQAYPDMGNFSGAIAAIEASAWIAHKSGLQGPIA